MRYNKRGQPPSPEAEPPRERVPCPSRARCAWSLVRGELKFANILERVFGVLYIYFTLRTTIYMHMCCTGDETRSRREGRTGARCTRAHRPPLTLAGSAPSGACPFASFTAGSAFAPCAGERLGELAGEYASISSSSSSSSAMESRVVTCL